MDVSQKAKTTQTHCMHLRVARVRWKSAAGLKAPRETRRATDAEIKKHRTSAAESTARKRCTRHLTERRMKHRMKNAA